MKMIRACRLHRARAVLPVLLRAGLHAPPAFAQDCEVKLGVAAPMTGGGAAWGLADAHELRFGAVYDEAPIPADTLRPSIPDSDRTGATAGYGYASETWGLDAYAMGLWFDEATASAMCRPSSHA